MIPKSEVRVLVADDFDMVRNIVKSVLTGKGLEPAQILFASNGEEAWNQVEASKNSYAINIVLSDWNMPKLNGFELLKKIRGSSDETVKDVPFVLITSEAEKDAIIEALDAGASEYIVKPFDDEMLIKKLQKFIDFT